MPGAVGAFVGASVLTSIDGAAAKPWIAGLLLLLGVLVLGRFAFGVIRKPAPESALRPRHLGPLGVVAGFVDAIGGGGWGPVTTPTLLTFGRLEPRRTIGSVSASEFLVSLAASLGFMLGLSGEPIEVGLVLALLIGGVCVAPFAAMLVQRLDARVTGTLVGVLVIVTNALHASNRRRRAGSATSPADHRPRRRWSDARAALVAQGQVGAHHLGAGRPRRRSRRLARCYQPRSIHSWRWGRSAPIVVRSPWPGSTMVSAGSLNRRSSIERMIVGKSPPAKPVAPGPPGKSVSPLKRIGWPLEAVADRARGVPGSVDRVEPQPADVDPGVVLDHLVVRRQHAGVLRRDTDRVARIAQLRHGLDVVPVAMGLEHSPDPEPLAQLQETVVLVGRVEQHRIARLGATQNEHVVVDGAYDDLMDLHPRCLPDERVGHGLERMPGLANRQG